MDAHKKNHEPAMLLALKLSMSAAAGFIAVLPLLLR